MGLKQRLKSKTAPDVEFIGRRNIVNEFLSEWDKSIDKDPQFIFNIFGASGIGKSVLFNHLVQYVSDTDYVCKLDANFNNLSNPVSLIAEIIEGTKLKNSKVEFRKTHLLLSRLEKIVGGEAKNWKEVPLPIVAQATGSGSKISLKSVGIVW
jgi:hypothetical protein